MSERSFAQQILTVASLELTELLKGVRGLLVVVLYGGLVFGVGSTYLFLSGKIEDKLAESNPELATMDRQAVFKELVASEQFQKELGPWLEQIGGARFAESIADGSMPLILLFILLASGLALPPLVLVAGYDRLSEDLTSRYSRFVLQRVRRETWVIGKVLGLWAGLLGLVILVQIALAGIATGIAPRFDGAAVWKALPLVWVALALFLLAYVAFVTLFSGLLRPPFAALAVGGMALMAMWVLKLAIPVIGALWMGAWDLKLWLLEPSAIVAFAVHAALLGGLAVLVVRTRDV